MRADEAVAALSTLAAQKGLEVEAAFIEWQSKVGAILRATFGANSVQVAQFDLLTVVKNEGYTTARGRQRDRELWRQDAAQRGKAEIRAAIFTLETLRHESPLDDASIDPELWAHVQGLIADNDWAKVPAAVAIFVEDKVRTWAGDPRDPNGATLVGKGLYAKALNNTGPLRMGRQESETQGWMFLGTGLAQAIGNVDRHRIQQRADVKRYAMGVLGLGSLLLTQLHYEHPAEVQEAEASSEGLSADQVEAQ